VTAPVGLVFGSLTPPEGIASAARRAEDAGFSEFWISEDCFFSGGVAGLAQVLGATRRAPVGTGVLSVMSRHPAVTAMEFAGLARAYPGRVRAGVGLGVRAWLAQMGRLPDAPLTVVRETVAALRALLAGKEVTLDGHAHRLDRIRLDFPPPAPPPIHLGAVNEAALRAAGRIADGTILSVLAGPAYVRRARQLIAAPDHRITTFVLYAVDHDRDRARAAVRDAVAMFLTAEACSALVRVPGHDAELAALLAEDTDVPLAQRIPDAWLDEFAVAGTPAECAAGLRRLLDAGSDALGLWLFPTDRADQVAALTAAEVLPRLAR
jgi:alkanesulfonate monooxygenase SsuD/methylene tetrahydromethanopterin reductase-like flavin-dependent oxidoreductase (luciferase family)